MAAERRKKHKSKFSRHSPVLSEYVMGVKGQLVKPSNRLGCSRKTPTAGHSIRTRRPRRQFSSFDFEDEHEYEDDDNT